MMGLIPDPGLHSYLLPAATAFSQMPSAFSLVPPLFSLAENQKSGPTVADLCHALEESQRGSVIILTLLKMSSEL